MKDSILKKWLLSENVLLTKDSDQKPTHLFLDGGRAYINFDKLDEFYEVCKECITKNIGIFVVECRTDIFKLFLDLDFIGNLSIEYDFIIEVVNHIQEIIYDLYGENQDVILCNTQSKMIEKNDKEYEKNGFHLFWPGIDINVSTALKIRDIIIDKLKIIYGERNEINKWADVVDESVFKSNGIRMNWSYKMNIVTNDRSRKYIPDTRFYKPLEIINSFKEKKDFYLTETEYSRFLKLTSIRTQADNITEIKNSEFLNKNYDTDSVDLKSENNDFYLKRIETKNSKYVEIIRFFNLHVTDYYSKDIKDILYLEEKDSYIIKTKSKYCQNIKREHNSCGIYFMLTKTGLIQRCYCKCNTMEGRCSGYCKNYKSAPIPCSLHLMKVLKWETKSNKQPKRANKEINNILQNKNVANMDFPSKVELFRNNLYSTLKSMN